jgi:hypothetical protein
LSKLIRLLAPVGTTEFSHGTSLYLVRSDRHVDAPVEAVDALLKTGGFVLAPLADVSVVEAAHSAIADHSPAFVEALITELQDEAAEQPPQPAPTPIAVPTLAALTIPN